MKALVAAALVVSAMPLVAAAGQQGATSTSDERLVCRRTDVNSASRVQTRRTCLTRAQWRARRVTVTADDGMEELETRSQRMGGFEHGVTPAKTGESPR
jgi:hypothetical protein